MGLGIDPEKLYKKARSLAILRINLDDTDKRSFTSSSLVFFTD